MSQTIDCKLCGKGFASRQSMQRHNRRIHRLMPYYVLLTKAPIIQYECYDVDGFLRTNNQLMQQICSVYDPLSQPPPDMIAMPSKLM